MHSDMYMYMYGIVDVVYLDWKRERRGNIVIVTKNVGQAGKHRLSGKRDDITACAYIMSAWNNILKDIAHEILWKSMVYMYKQSKYRRLGLLSACAYKSER